MGHYTVTLTIKDKDLDKRNWAPKEVCDRLKKWTECGITRGKGPDVDPIQVHNYTIEVERVEGEPMRNEIEQIDEFLLEVARGEHMFHDAVETVLLPRKTTPVESYHDGEIFHEGTRPYLMVIAPTDNDFNAGIIPTYQYVFGVPYYWEIPNATEKQKENHGGISHCYGWTDLYGNIYNNAWEGPESNWEDTVVGFFCVTEDILPHIKSEKYPGPWKD